MTTLRAMLRCLVLTVGLAAWGGAVHAACTSPAGEAGQIRYATNLNMLVYCNDTDWVGMSGGGGSGGGGGGSDNLGNHTATQALDMGGYNINNAGTIYGTGAALGGLTVTGNSSLNNVSATLLQVGNNGVACSNGISGSIRYSSVSSTIEYCNSTAWVSMGPSDTAPVAFYVHRNGVAQPIANNTDTVIDWTTKSFDTNNNFDLAQNRFIPTVPGYYMLSFKMGYAASTGAALTYGHIRKNNVAIASSFGFESFGPHYVSVFAYANGTTDYFDTATYQTTGGSVGVEGAITYTYFTGARISAGGSGGGGGGGASALNDLSDVDTSGATAGSVIRYDGANWVVSTTGDGNALGDRITSGTLAMVANSATSYVSLSTNGTTWGYLNSGLSYLPALGAGQVSATNISGTLIQVGGGNGAVCDASRKGAIRYSDSSSTLQYCNSNTWMSVGPSDTMVTASALRTVAATIANAAWTNVTFGYEGWDTAGMIDIATQPQRVTIAPGQGGYYIVSSRISFNTNTSGARWQAIMLNGAQAAICNGMSGTMNGYYNNTCTNLMYLNPGDYLGLQVYQNRGGDLDLMLAELSVAKLSGGSGSGGGGGATQLSALTDVQLTNLAGRDYLRYDSVAGKWVNISESTVMSTTTMVNGWPDAILCTASGKTLNLYAGSSPDTDGRYYYYEPGSSAADRFVGFNADGSYHTQATRDYTDCKSSISAIYAAGRAFNFIGNSGASGGGDALGDRIVSGTLAMVANSATSYVSLSTGGTTWGYFNSGASFLPTLVGNRVSATNVSATVVQVGTSGLACSAGLAGAIRYNGGSLEYCNGSAWTALGSGSGTVSGTGAANHIAYWTGSDALSHDANQLYWDAANNQMGIGTNAPGAPLGIVGANSESIVFIRGGAGGVGESSFFNAQGRSRFGYDGGRAAVLIDDGGVNGVTATKPIVFDTAGSERMRINSNGNVGVGTLTPYATLSVGAGSNSANRASGLLVRETSDTTIGTTAGSYVYPAEIQYGSGNNSRLQFAGYRRVAGSAWHGTGYRMQFAVDNSFTDGSKAYVEVGSRNSLGAGMVALGTDGVDRLWASSQGVGIGKTNPLAALDVAGTVSASDAVQVGTSSLVCSAGIPGAIRYNGGNVQYCNGTAWTSLSSSTTAGTSGSGAANHIAYWTGSDTLAHDANQLYWDATNNRMGIGLNNPNTALGVVGDISASDGITLGRSGGAVGQMRSVSGNYGVIHRNDGSMYYILLTDSGDAYGTFNSLRPFYINVATGELHMAANRFYVSHTTGSIRTNGSVDVGTQVYGNSGDSAATPTYSWTGDTNTGVFTPGADQVGITTGGVERLRVTAAGGVGIGTTAPTAGLLEVSSSEGIRLTKTGGSNNSPFISWHRSGVRQAYMGWGTPGSVFQLVMENSNNLSVTSANSTFSGNVTAVAFLYSSDKRVKENVVALTGGLAKLEALNPVTFSYISDTTHRMRLGVMAQDVEAVYPEAVVTDPKTGLKSVDYPALVPVLIQSVKELKAENEKLRGDHDSLLRRLEALERRAALQ